MGTLPLPEPLIAEEEGPPWGLAPKWANWWQANVGGESWWWQCEPVKHEWYWLATEGYVPQYAGRILYEEMWWHTSLRKRPGYEEGDKCLDDSGNEHRIFLPWVAR